MQQHSATDEGGKGQEHAFPAQRVPWTIAEGFVLFLAFILIHGVLAAVGDALVPAGVASEIRLAGGSAAVLLLFCIFLKVRCGGGANAGRLVGLCPPKGLGAALRPLLVGMMALLAALLVMQILLRHFNVHPPEQPMVGRFRNLARQGSYLEFAGLFVLAVVVVPITEELTFRGLLYLPLRCRLGPVWAALIVSSLFALTHGHLAGVAYLFILALIFTELMEATGSLVVPMVAHAVHNGCVIALIVIASKVG